jgi:hypothetical protein
MTSTDTPSATIARIGAYRGGRGGAAAGRAGRRLVAEVATRLTLQPLDRSSSIRLAQDVVASLAAEELRGRVGGRRRGRLNAIVGSATGTLSGVLQVLVYNAIWFSLSIVALVMSTYRPAVSRDDFERATAWTAQASADDHRGILWSSRYLPSRQRDQRSGPAPWLRSGATPGWPWSAQTARGRAAAGPAGRSARLGQTLSSRPCTTIA